LSLFLFFFGVVEGINVVINGLDNVVDGLDVVVNGLDVANDIDEVVDDLSLQICSLFPLLSQRGEEKS
jgi:hypothetical protein